MGQSVARRAGVPLLAHQDALEAVKERQREGKVVALLYGDNVPGNGPIPDTDSLEIFLSQAGLAMERALLQRRLQGKAREEL